jgi:hypothetical protein
VKWAEHVSCLGEMRNSYRILVDTRRKRQFGKPVPVWKSNIKIDVKVVGYEGIGLIYLAQSRFQWKDFVDTILNLRFP